MVTTKDISYLARQMAQQKSKYIFWLGAGMSLTAGIPTSVGVVDRLIDRYLVRFPSVGGRRQQFATILLVV